MLEAIRGLAANIENSRQLRQVYLSEKGKIKERVVFCSITFFSSCFHQPKNGEQREKNTKPPPEREV